MNRRTFLSAIGAGAVAPLRAQGRKPNIVFILADDLGIANLGCYGGDGVTTPHIDALAKGGIRYTNAYTAPLCGPSRALIMTGRYAFRTGATNQDVTGKITTAAETFLPAMLKPAGYASSMVGKWGQLPDGPAEFGFDEHFRIAGSGAYWASQEGKKTYIVNGEKRTLGGKEYLPDLMHRAAVDFMERKRSQPFLLYYSLSHIHGEILETPDSKPGSDHYTDNIAYMDKLVGRFMAELDRLKLRENTLVIFFGDNGTAENYSDRATIKGRRLSGAKGAMLEGGPLVPMIASWRGTAAAGQVSNQLIDSTDFLPTFAELAGARLPDKPIDGHSFAPQLRGQKGKPREWVFLQLARMWFVRDQRWKLNEKGELYDMSGAPFEEKLVPAGAEPAARQRLQAVLDKLNPAGGILDHGTGDGRHARNSKKRNKK